jgi:hypothetical protein
MAGAFDSTSIVRQTKMFGIAPNSVPIEGENDACNDVQEFDAILHRRLPQVLPGMRILRRSVYRYGRHARVREVMPGLRHDLYELREPDGT